MSIASRRSATPVLRLAVLTAFLFGCATEPHPTTPLVELVVEQSVVQPGSTVHFVATSREDETVLFDVSTIRLQRRIGVSWRDADGLESDGRPTISKAFGVGPRQSRAMSSTLTRGVVPGVYRIAFLAYTQSLTTEPGTIATEPFAVQE